MDKTGSTTNIGFVYEANFQEFSDIIKLCFKYLNISKINEANYTFDCEKEWVKLKEISISDEFLLKLYNAQMFNLNIEFTINNKNALVLIEKGILLNNQAIVLCFYDKYMLEVICNNDLQRYTEFCINLIEDIFTSVKALEYVFCDNNAYFKYSLAEILGGKHNEYSLIFIPQKNNELKMLKSSWEIDGFTERG